MGEEVVVDPRSVVVTLVFCGGSKTGLASIFVLIKVLQSYFLVTYTQTGGRPERVLQVFGLFRPVEGRTATSRDNM